MLISGYVCRPKRHALVISSPNWQDPGTILGYKHCRLGCAASQVPTPAATTTDKLDQTRLLVRKGFGGDPVEAATACALPVVIPWAGA